MVTFTEGEYYVEEGTPHIKTDYDELTDQNVCCGICGEVMNYDLLMSHHLPTAHPEVVADGTTDFEEVSYDVSLESIKSQYIHPFRHGSGDEVYTTNMGTMSRLQELEGRCGE